MTTGISTWSFLTVSAQLLSRAPFYKKPHYFLWDTCSVMYKITITSDQTKPRSLSIISKLVVELPWVCSCFLMERYPRAASGHRGSSELLVPLRASSLQLPSCFGGGSCLEKVPSMLEPLKELFFVGESRSVKILRPAWGISHFRKKPWSLWETAYACLLQAVEESLSVSWLCTEWCVLTVFVVNTAESALKGGKGSTAGWGSRAEL